MKLDLGDYLAELDSCGDGSVVAFFDLDHTLIDGYSISALAWQQFFNGKIGPRRSLQLGAMFLSWGLKRIGYEEMLQATVDDIAGMDELELHELGQQAYRNRVSHWIYDEGRELVAAHAARGHDVVMVTSATKYQAEPVARELGIEHMCCTELEIIERKVSGKVTACYGPGKLTAAYAYLADTGARMEDAYFYSDSYEDMPLLEVVGYPVVVNGKPRLTEVAEQRAWPQLTFVDKGKAA
jgi:putative phosphoserine phosphatase/1-acylglycerol-3-phosphate O-acyltransferase